MFHLSGALNVPFCRFKSFPFYSILIIFTFCLQSNLFVFLLAIQASTQFKSTACDYGNLRTLLWLSIILVPLLVALWILALLSINDTIDELHYAYSLTTFISALYIFLAYCLANRRVRFNLQTNWHNLSHRTAGRCANNGNGSDESFSATRTSVTSRNGNGGYYHAGSTFDIYGLNNPHLGMGGLISHPNLSNIGAVLSSSSTTSRSTLTKGSTGLVDRNEDGDFDITNEGVYHTHRKHHHHKCRRRHRKRSKSSIGVSETGSSDDISYDYPMELASSHSSDEDDNITNVQKQSELLKQQQENQINQLLHDQQQSKETPNSGIYIANPMEISEPPSSDMSSNAPTVIYGQQNIVSGTPAILLQQNDDNQANLITSNVGIRSNLLAMTAGFSDASSNIYGHNLPSTQPAQQQQIEHIYSYARKPNQLQQPAHYSTLGPIAPTNTIIDDNVGLPPITTGTTYRLHYQSIKENPMAPSHVRLLQPQLHSSSIANKSQDQINSNNSTESNSNNLNSSSNGYDSRIILTANKDRSNR